ncbi:MAG: hypothetical protein IKA64_02000 [Clostridia bacterium]|nr:hypothetical protein [Clostridia bacterium]
MNEIIARGSSVGMSAVEESQAIAEIQAKMIMARQFPRDIERCRAYIAAECKNEELAKVSTYEFKRGTSVVKGPSIRLVECVARYWGNIISGVKEIASDGSRATVRAYCWDLETNFADEKVFDVPYVRETKSGVVPVTSERDKYEVMANMAARRKRACIQAVIPKFIIDEAVAQCEAYLEEITLKDGIEVTREKMLTAFTALGDWVTKEHLETVINKPFDSFNAKDIVRLRSLYNAIKDGFVKLDAALGRASAEIVDEAAANTLATVNERLGKTGNGTDEG